MPADMPQAPTPVAQQSFACASCDNEAGRIALFERGDGGEIARNSFMGLLTFPVGAEDFERIRRIIHAGDIQAVHEFQTEVSIFYCSGCGTCYCGEHWAWWSTFDDEEGFDWHDSIRGLCPRGHRRMLQD